MYVRVQKPTPARQRLTFINYVEGIATTSRNHRSEFTFAINGNLTNLRKSRVESVRWCSESGKNWNLGEKSHRTWDILILRLLILTFHIYICDISLNSLSVLSKNICHLSFTYWIFRNFDRKLFKLNVTFYTLQFCILKLFLKFIKICWS